MGRGKSILFLIAVGSLVYLAAFFLSFSDQAYYHCGFDMTLREDGFHILKVLPGSEAERLGLRKDMVITRLGGTDAVELNQISDSDLNAFLALSTRLFKIGRAIELQAYDGSEIRLSLQRLPLATRFPLLDGEVLSNLTIGTLFILAGIWLLAIGRDDPSVKWFLGFTVGIGLALSVGYFNSYWSTELLAFRFVLLDIAGVAACIFLVGFVRRFPVPKTLSITPLVIAPMAALAVKYLLIIIGAVEPYGYALYFIHIFLVVALGLIIVLLAKRYREVSAGGKRKLRWILAGIALSLVPYTLYVLSLLMRSSILNNGRSILNYISGYSILLFPVFVCIGVVKYNLFDIDRFLNRFAALFFLGFLATLAYSVLSLFFLESALSFDMYLLLLATAIAAPSLYQKLDSTINRLLSRGRKNKGQILLEMEQELIGVFRTADVFPIVSSAMVFAFDPVRLIFRRYAQGSDIVEYRYPPGPHPSAAIPENPEDLRYILSRKDEEDRSFNIGKKRDEDIYTKEDLHLLAGAAAQISKALENCDLYRRLQESIANESNSQRAAILTLAKLTEYRDHETGRHLERIQEYSRILAMGLRDLKLDADYLTDEYIDSLCLSSILHDIGKVGIPDQILLKPDRLLTEEFEIIKKHPLIGGRVLEDAEKFNPDRSFLSIGKLVAYHHHEKWDGSGYPYGLKAEAIPLSARIVAIADVYDALRSNRPYKPAFTHEKAVDIIQEGGGTQFDPELIQVFLAIQTQMEAIPRGA